MTTVTTVDINQRVDVQITALGATLASNAVRTHVARLGLRSEIDPLERDMLLYVADKLDAAYETATSETDLEDLIKP